MSKDNQPDILRQGTNAWNKWRATHPHVKINLRGANLENANLKGANLESADLRGADLRGANLESADLSKANLYEAVIAGAYLINANLSSANLSCVILSEADLSYAKLIGVEADGSDFLEADLHGADLSDANFAVANFAFANLSEADLSGACLMSANLNDADLSGADLTGCVVYGVSAWNIKLERTIQSDLIITPANEPTITVDNLEVAQFIYLLLKYEKLRDVLNSVMERGVLLLGRFGGGGLGLLQSIAVKLREMQYMPIIFDFEKPESRDFTETIMTLAGLSRFIIVDLSGPSVPNELRSTIPNFKIPYVPIIEKGRKIYSMFPDLLEYPWVLPAVEFTSKEHLFEIFSSEVIVPAENKFKERQALLKQIFNR